MSVHIGQKTQQRVPLHCKGKLPVLVQNNLKVRNAIVTVFLYQMDQIQDGVVKFGIFRAPRLKDILNLHRISQFIVGQHIAVAVIDIPPGAENIPGLLNLQSKILQILLPMDNLQVKTAPDQNTAQKAEYHTEYRQSAGQDSDKFFL